MKSVTSLFVLSVLLCSTTVSWSATINSRGVGISKVGSHEFGGIYNFSTFLLDRESGILYLGARDAVIAVDTTNLSKRKTIEWSVPEEKRKSCVAKGKTEDDCKNYVRLLEFLGDRRIYACGTFAFDPQCAFINISSFSLETNEDGSVKMETGKGKCPFEPSQHYTAVMAGGILYTAATSNFLGTMYDISRATGMEQERIRTEQSINWLSDPEFVSSAFIQEDEENNPTGEDDKIYFFFTEVAKEYDLYTKVKVPRVARVCKSDVGGMKTLQRRWTTFLKAQLVCEDRASGQRFNVLTDVFTVQHQPGDPSSTHFYGIFTSQWEREELSAVCVYSLEEITKVMNGPFKELKKSCENWINPEPIPTPRPGQCLNNALKQQGFESSLKLPDKVLTFMRDHPLMENSVVAAPLMIRNGITYTKLAVTLTTASNGSKQQMVTVLHLGTDRGQLHKVAVVGPNATLIEEVSLFSAQEPVNNILLYKDKALVGSPLSLVKLPIVGCSFYTTCEVCARAHGLGCVWSHKDGACAMAKPGKVVEPEDLANQCNKEDEPQIEIREDPNPVSVDISFQKSPNQKLKYLDAEPKILGITEITMAFFFIFAQVLFSVNDTGLLLEAMSGIVSITVIIAGSLAIAAQNLHPPTLKACLVTQVVACVASLICIILQLDFPNQFYCWTPEDSPHDQEICSSIQNGYEHLQALERLVLAVQIALSATLAAYCCKVLPCCSSTSNVPVIRVNRHPEPQ
ncbi:semaphorin-4F-like isoform X2 [Myxocyprinus asiaticus]|uniref:semaphorin-4F-like isoform X2 n=1 Tax=Myxocyprinus asiaticus TaxID=70543 RepID=UPI0022227DD5|nr:semaphorin-4F-like isoform X2 [Myxocyprinus asiaticus]